MNTRFKHLGRKSMTIPSSLELILGLASFEGLEERCGRVLPVTLWIVLNPAPEVGAGILQRQLCLPTQLLVGKGRVSSEIQNVALSALDNLVGKITPNNVAKGLDHLENCAAAAGSQIPCLDTRLVVSQVLERRKVPARKVQHVDVIANCRAILGCVVCRNLATATNG